MQYLARETRIYHSSLIKQRFIEYHCDSDKPILKMKDSLKFHKVQEFSRLKLKNFPG